MKGHACWSYSNNFYFNLNSLNHWISAIHPFYPWLGRRQTHPTSGQTGTLSSEQGSVNDVVKNTSVNDLISILGTILINHMQRKDRNRMHLIQKRCRKRYSGVIRLMSLSFIKEEKRMNHLLQ